MGLEPLNQLKSLQLESNCITSPAAIRSLSLNRYEQKLLYDFMLLIYPLEKRIDLCFVFYQHYILINILIIDYSIGHCDKSTFC